MGDEDSFSISTINADPKKCPLDLEFEIVCDELDCLKTKPFLFLKEVDQGLYSLAV